MKTATLSIKIDPTVKQDAQHLAQQVGLPLGSLINGLLKDAIRKQSVTFSTHQERFPSEQMTPQMEKIIEQAEQDIKNGETIGPFDTVEDFLKALRA